MTASQTASSSRPMRLGGLHAAAIGAATFVVVYMLCWIGAALGWSFASHLYLSLFATASDTSLSALISGLCLSFGFGALVGALVAIFHALFGFLAPR